MGGYYHWYKSRGCDAKAGMKTLLDWIERSIATLSDEDLCMYVARLAYDTKTDIKRGMYKVDQLRPILSELVVRARTCDFSRC